MNAAREEIADYLGGAGPSFSMELGRMQWEEIIRIDGHEVFILSQELFANLFE